MDRQQVDNAIEHITSLQEKLNSSKNDQQYIKRLQALKHWLYKFDSLLDNASKQQGEYKKVYESYFQPCSGFSFYDRVYHSILSYQYGDRPF